MLFVLVLTIVNVGNAPIVESQGTFKTLESCSEALILTQDALEVTDHSTSLTCLKVK
jgi:hypothetical protein